jgi:hypothetical protein
VEQTIALKSKNRSNLGAILPSSDSKLLQDDTLVIKSGGLKEGSERCDGSKAVITMEVATVK